MGPTQYDGCPYKRVNFRHRDRHEQKEDDMKTQAEHHIKMED